MSLNFTNPTDSPDFAAAGGIGGGVLVNVIGQTIPPTSTVTIKEGIYVGSAPSLALNLQFSVAHGEVLFTWDYANTFNPNDLGTEYFFANQASVVNDIVPVISPFLSIRATNTDVGAGLFSLQLAATKSVGGAPTFASNRIMIGGSSVVAANGAVNLSVPIVIPGPANLFCIATGGAARAELFSLLDTSGNFVAVGAVEATATQVAANGTVAVPAGDCRLGITNKAGVASTIFYALTSLR